jgi:sugar phosphate isomerase/epimerase
VNAICSMGQPLADDIALWADLGINHVGLITPKIEAIGWKDGEQVVRDAGLRVSSVSCYKEGLAGSVEFTASVGADVLYLPPGSGGSLLWDEAADRFCADIAPWVALGARHGVRLALEPTNPLRSDVSFVHSFRDAADLARRAGMGVVLDFYSTWYERGLDKLVRDNIDVVALVQVDDYKLGTFSMPNRSAVGDGDVPVERLVAMVLEAGYQGAFDLEILGPRIDEEGYRAPIARSLQRLSEMLDRLRA